VVDGPGAVAQLTFVSPEDPDELAGRLRDAGYRDVEIVRQDFGTHVSVTDPDGQNVQIYEQRA